MNLINKIKNISTNKIELRKFSFISSLLLLFIAFYLFYIENELYQIFLIIGLFAMIVGLLFPLLIKPFYFIWMTIGIIIGWVMTQVILCAIFYAIISPIGLFLKLFGRSPLDLNINNEKKSYWIYKKNDSYKKSSHEKQY